MFYTKFNRPIPKIKFQEQTPEADKPKQSSDIKNNGKYVCSSCPEKFLTNTDLQNHVTSHLIAKKNETQESPKIEENKEKKKEKVPEKEKTVEKEPIRSKRLQEKRLKKEISSIKRKILPIRIKFKSQSEIKRVQRKACPVCNKRIPSENMKAHLQAHNKCEKCSRIFKKHENLLRHNCNSQKMYRCASCPKEFTNSRNRNSHQRKIHPELEVGTESERQ